MNKTVALAALIGTIGAGAAYAPEAPPRRRPSAKAMRDR